MDVSKELEHYIKTLATRVKDNLDIVTPETLGQDFLLHISSNPSIKTFIPLIGHRQATSEDRTVPRVCTADTLIGCLVGYAMAVSEILNYHKVKDPKKAAFKQGWTIYGFEFVEALKPNKRLVYDADASNEHWLVSYSPDSTEYKPIKLGKMFFDSINFKIRSNDFALCSVSIHIHNSSDKILRLTENITIPKGYWKCTIFDYNRISFNMKNKIEVIELTKEEYDTQKDYSAAMLSENPSFMNW